jgi:hypothetical protein
MVKIVSTEKQQEILKHIRKHGCKVFIHPGKEGLTQAHVRIMLERNLDGSKLAIQASNWGEVVTTDVMDLVLKQKERQKD